MEEQRQSGEWKNGLFGCFSNCCLCAITYFAPCYVSGKVAEKTGESFWLYCCLALVPIANIICGSKIRGKIREEKQIDGTNMNDCLVHWFCALCAIVQEATEVDALDSGSMAVHPAQEISRSWTTWLGTRRLPDGLLFGYDVQVVCNGTQRWLQTESQHFNGIID